MLFSLQWQVFVLFVLNYSWQEKLQALRKGAFALNKGCVLLEMCGGSSQCYLVATNTLCAELCISWCQSLRQSVYWDDKVSKWGAASFRVHQSEEYTQNPEFPLNSASLYSNCFAVIFFDQQMAALFLGCAKDKVFTCTERENRNDKHFNFFSQRIIWYF